MMLKALETGNALKFTLNTQNYTNLQNSGHDLLSGSSAEQWLDFAAEMYLEVSPYLTRVAGQQIVRHMEPFPGVTLTAFENGVSILVNYTNEAASWSGHTAAPMGYAVWEDVQ
jgi:hypothetical protein